MKTYKVYLYLLVSIYIFIQTSFFPQKLAHLLMTVFASTADGKTIITSPHTMVQYYNIVVCGGLAIAGTLFLVALRLVVRRFAKGRGIVVDTIELVFRLLAVVLIFLCTVTIYHLFRGEQAGLFSLSNETLVTLMVLLVCLVWDFFRRHIRPRMRGNIV